MRLTLFALLGIAAADSVTNAVQAIETLNSVWYSTATGLWDNAWWESACALTTIADFAHLRPQEARNIKFSASAQSTFAQAQKSTAQRKRAFQNVRRGYEEFIDRFYDDEGHWAIALLKAYDATHDQRYLNAAVDLFNDMQTGRGTPCKGGIFWSKDRTYVNAVANELYLAVAASLALHIPSNGTYLAIARDQWEWFAHSGLINSKGLINDGLNSDCTNNGLPTWSYNQGIILGGLTDLAHATGNQGYITHALRIARRAIAALSNENGILEEVDKCELKAGHCGIDGKTFKGIFVRNLRYLYDAAPQADIRAFILRNADSVWKNARDPKTGKLGVAWTGPYVEATGPSHGSALDVLVAAIAVQ